MMKINNATHCKKYRQMNLHEILKKLQGEKGVCLQVQKVL